MRNVSARNTPAPAPAPAPADLGELERSVLSLIWASPSPVTADAIRESLLPERVLKDSTIRTVLRRLEEKGFLSHTVDNRTFFYKAKENPQRVAAKAVQRIIDWFLNGSTEELLVGMVDSDMLDEAELSRLAAKIAAARDRNRNRKTSKGTKSK